MKAPQPTFAMQSASAPVQPQAKAPSQPQPLQRAQTEVNKAQDPFSLFDFSFPPSAQ